MKKLLIVFILLAANFLYSQTSTNSKNNFRLGFIIGDPTTFMLAAGKDMNDYSFRISTGGWIDETYTIQSELIYKLYKRDTFEQNIGLIAGYNRGKKLYERTFYNYYFHWNVDHPGKTNSFYLGPSYRINWSHFYIQASAVVGTGNFKYPRLLMQIGYYLDI